MSKRYSGKSFKDSSTAKKPKLSLKEKRKNKKKDKKSFFLIKSVKVVNLKSRKDIFLQQKY